MRSIKRWRSGPMSVALAMMPHRRRIDDPAELQLARIESLDVLPFFGDPVAENLTGRPGPVFDGDTPPAQLIVTYPRLAQVDPAIGVGVGSSARRLPNRRSGPVI